MIAAVEDALYHAHRHGVVYRDIKRANILLNGNDRPFVCEFGLALKEADFGKGAVSAGTPAYGFRGGCSTPPPGWRVAAPTGQHLVKHHPPRLKMSERPSTRCPSPRACSGDMSAPVPVAVAAGSVAHGPGELDTSAAKNDGRRDGASRPVRCGLLSPACGRRRHGRDRPPPGT